MKTKAEQKNLIIDYYFHGQIIDTESSNSEILLPCPLTITVSFNLPLQSLEYSHPEDLYHDS